MSASQNIRNNRNGCTETQTFYLGLMALHYAPFLNGKGDTVYSVSIDMKLS
ncbi:TPA: 1-aminocyclopropane-1-carboxylate deaminase/D-cysteine desulfhydrase, partial [Vibrio parahaemolyticus]|nr:1-aminocyclopropane-1-carboxylate deaminase/D-cysteine desulfhydrase [Vibrio parahaemolyticus]